MFPARLVFKYGWWYPDDVHLETLDLSDMNWSRIVILGLHPFLLGPYLVRCKLGGVFISFPVHRW